MTPEPKRDDPRSDAVTQHTPFPLWAGAAMVVLLAVVVFLFGLLGVSVMERRWEAQRPQIVVQPHDASCCWCA